MTKVKCEHCGGEFGINDTIKVSGVTLCEQCAEREFADGRKVPADQLERPADPTICCNCRTDNLNAPLPLLAGLPVCSACESFFRNRPFPAWVKAGMIAIVMIVVGSLAWNARFMQAYYEMRVSAKAMMHGDIEKGTALMISASKRVPESTELEAVAAFYDGLNLLRQEKYVESIEKLKRCQALAPGEFEIQETIMHAEMGLAFEKKDYDKFLELAMKLDEKYKQESMYAAQLASAYACKYAETENDQFKTKSLAALDRAREASKADPVSSQYFEEYEDRILHRLHTRQIIDRDEFIEKFPNGWKQGKE